VIKTRRCLWLVMFVFLSGGRWKWSICRDSRDVSLRFGRIGADLEVVEASPDQLLPAACRDRCVRANEVERLADVALGEEKAHEARLPRHARVGGRTRWCVGGS
jgi:hypothetical protein